MRPHRGLILLAVAALAAAHGTIAHAQCSPDALWQFSVPVTQVATDSKTGAGVSYFGVGRALHAVWNETGSLPVPHTAGTTRWSVNVASVPMAPGATIQNFPAPVPAGPGGEVLFISVADGFLHKVNAADGSSGGMADTRRATCPEDQAATASVQLYVSSNPAFQSHVLSTRGYPDDVVYLVTRNQCGDETHNRIIAYWASDLTVKWTFNATGSFSVGYGADAVAVDYELNRVYCGTHQATPTQSTLWAINGMSGAIVWSQNAGSIRNRPMLNSATGGLYVASTDGTIQKRDRTSGALIWSCPVPGPIVKNAWPEFRSGFKDKVLVIDSAGNLHGIEDQGATATALWPPISPGGGATFTTMPVVAGDIGRMFIGRNDGFIQMLSTAGAPEALVQAGAPGTLLDPTLDVSGPAAPLTDRLLVPLANGTVQRFCIPWSSGLAVQPSSADPGALELGQSTPNPFRTAARIDYALPFAGRVQLVVYDVQGGRVRKLVGAEQASGRHAVTWDGLDDSGRPVESGVYLYRLQARGPGGRTLERSRKIQLVR